MSVRENRFYVYVYIDPRTNEPFYIGKGSGGRAWVHISLAHGLRTESSFYHHLDQMLDDDIFPEVELVKQRLSDAEAFRSEQALILLVGSQSLGNGPLCNTLPGKPVRAWGKTFPSLRAVSRDSRCVISSSVLYHRLKRGLSIEAAAKGPRPTKIRLGVPINCWGETFPSTAALLRDPRCSVSKHRLSIRLREGWPLEDAVRIPWRVKLWQALRGPPSQETSPHT